MDHLEINKPVVRKNDTNTPPKVFNLKSRDAGGRCIITDSDGVDHKALENELKPAPPAKDEPVSRDV